MGVLPRIVPVHREIKVNLTCMRAERNTDAFVVYKCPRAGALG